MKDLVYYFVFFLILYPLTASAEDSTKHCYKKELLLIGENDGLRFNKKDGYYTNGIFIRFSTPLPKKKMSVIQFYEIYQLMFNANYRIVLVPEQIDRPIAGFLSLKYGQNRFLSPNTILQWNIGIGVLGKASQAERVQNLFHRNINIVNPLVGWQWQVKDEVGINGGVSLAKSFTFPINKVQLQVEPCLQLNGGNTFTNANFSPIFKLGIFNTGKQNSWWGGHLFQNKKHQARQTEVYLYTQPSIGYHWYNATVQGGMFRKDKGEVIAAIYPWLFRQNTGLVYSKPRWSASFSVCYMGKEAKTQIREQRYRSLQFAWRFN
jgi:hypothetical protein